MAALPFLIAALAGFSGGRWAGWRGWFVPPAVVALALVLSLVVAGHVDPFLLAISLVWALVAALGVLVGLLLRRRARRARA